MLYGLGNNSCVIDVETDALREWKMVHTIVVRSVNDNSFQTFSRLHERPDEVERLKQHLRGFDGWVGHNIIEFDLEVVRNLGVEPPVYLLDTLVVSRLLNQGLEGGHSLEAWGERFGTKKSLFNDFSAWSAELEARCIVDTEINLKLLKYILKYIKSPEWSKSIHLEHQSTVYCKELSKNGFKFDLEKAEEYRNQISLEVDTLLKDFQRIFPDRFVPTREITPTVTKQGTLKLKDFRWLPEPMDLSLYSNMAPFTLGEWVPFNPKSHKMVVDRLWEAGWNPLEKTKGHLTLLRKRKLDLEEQERLKDYQKYGWKINEDNLQTLPEDAPKSILSLTRYLILSHRLSTLNEWFAAQKDGEMHGQFISIGSWTHRKSHSNPNMANVPALVNRFGKPQVYGPEFRALFTARPGRVLVGCDAEGIQLRVFAHYTADPVLIEAIANGNKDEGTDIHTLNKNVLGTICNSRNSAKTYIYALLLGAGKAKQAAILQCSIREAEAGYQRILEKYPGWKRLKETDIARDGARGFFEGLDGRKVMHPGEHYVLAGYLQNGESTIMKLACERWHNELERKGLPFWFVDDVHDEWQTETLPEFGVKLGKIQEESIVWAGKELGLLCPLAGSSVVGQNWKDTH